jgi:K+-sensing histidine kinase KdpD
MSRSQYCERIDVSTGTNPAISKSNPHDIGCIPYVQENENRSGVGLGLTIAQRAIALIRGKIEVTNLSGKGCIFKITLPKKIGQSDLESKPAA